MSSLLTAGRHATAERVWPRRVVWLTLIAYAALWSLLDRTSPLGSWGYFRRAARALVLGGDHGGLHIYHYHPEYQFGPAATFASIPFAFLPKGIDKVAVGVALTVIGLACVHLVASVGIAGRWGRPEPLTLLWVGALLIPIWSELSINNGHLDDALALLFALLTLRAAAHAHPLGAGLCLAVAIDAKPWALAFAPLLLALPRRRREPALVALVLGVLAGWLPFFVADPDTIKALLFTIEIADDSPLRVLGVTAAETPSWCRPAQLAIAWGVGAWAVRRGQWGLVLLGAVAARIGLDPETFRYYTTGAAIAALVADRWQGWRYPWLTLATLSALWLPSRVLRELLPDGARGAVRLTWTLAMVTVAVVLAARHGDTARQSASTSAGEHSAGKRNDVTTPSNC